LISHLDAMWGDPRIAGFWERLASFSRLILFDKLGTGLSDPIDGVRPLEDRVDELRAVMDAVGSDRAALAGFSEGGPLSVLFAAAHPQRTSALVLCDSYATGTLDPRNPGADRWIEAMRRATEIVENHWGQGLTVQLLDPSNDGPIARRAFGIFERSAASPRMARAEIEMVTKIDVRDALPAIRVPTLILHREEEFIPVEQARYLAEHIAGARLVVTPGADHMAFYGDSETYLDEIERFLTGARAAVRADRVLATILFTDIVGSTERAAALGDAAWRQLLAQHDELVRSELTRHRGQEVKQTGDGFLATVDGPAPAIRCAEAIVDSVQARARGPRRASHRRVRVPRRRCRRNGRAHRVTDLRPRRAGRSARLEHRRGPRRRIGNPLRRPRDASAEGRTRILATAHRRPRRRTAGRVGAPGTRRTAAQAHGSNGNPHATPCSAALTPHNAPRIPRLTYRSGG
jgi:pimeloyl-ACP methyl ester carboxylesterase